MEALKLGKFQSQEIDENVLSSIVAGEACGTSWKNSDGSKSGRDHYFDVNDNGKLDAGDEVYLDVGQVVIKK